MNVCKYLKYQLVDVDVLLNSQKLELEMDDKKKGEFELKLRRVRFNF